MRISDWSSDVCSSDLACVVGEPTNPTRLGEVMKIGRRGSMNGWLTAHGTQGHVAYPHLADNAAHRLIRMLAAVTAEPLDDGTDHFQPSSVQIPSLDIGNQIGSALCRERVCPYV